MIIVSDISTLLKRKVDEKYPNPLMSTSLPRPKLKRLSSNKREYHYKEKVKNFFKTFIILFLLTGVLHWGGRVSMASTESSLHI